MSSFLQKATPFFEHIVIGLAYAAMGYFFFWTFNTSMLSVLGMVAVCFGGLKLLIGVIIHGAWIFALIFRPDYLKKKEQEEAKKEETKTFLNKWGTMIEVAVLLMGVLAILITKSQF
jgi:hypothetical protein